MTRARVFRGIWLIPKKSAHAFGRMVHAACDVAERLQEFLIMAAPSWQRCVLGYHSMEPGVILWEHFWKTDVTSSLPHLSITPQGQTRWDVLTQLADVRDVGNLTFPSMPWPDSIWDCDTAWGGTSAFPPVFSWAKTATARRLSHSEEPHPVNCRQYTCSPTARLGEKRFSHVLSSFALRSCLYKKCENKTKSCDIQSYV